MKNKIESKILTIKNMIESKISSFKQKMSEIFDSKTKLKIYRILGADIFQKVVFAVEKAKFIIINKMTPNTYDFFEKAQDKIFDRKMKKMKEEDSDLLLRYQLSKLKYRKELLTNKNINYHYNPDHPLEFIYYLNLNKKIHQKGIISNVIILAIILALSLLTSIPTIYIIFGYIFEVISLFINFECINLQNYNLERFQNEKTINILKKKEERQIEHELTNYRNCSKVVSARILNSTKIPTIEEVTSEIKDSKQAQELKVMASRRLKQLENEKKLESEKKLRRV